MAAWRILIVDDEQSICDVLTISLKKAGYVVASEINPRRALDRLKREPFDLVLQDLKMPEMDGIDLLREIKKLREETVVIIMTAYTTWDRAVEAMRLGAYDYIKKPFDTQIDIKGTISRALASRDQQLQFARTFDEMLGRVGLVVGYSKAMKTVRDLIQRAAPTDSTVIIQGESGVGKELIARALHYGSPRSARPFIAVNCGALTETLLESELFGHSKGSFTGAVSDKVGLVEVAHTGTLFLDEVSEMSPQLQVKVLRLLEEKEFKPVGSVTTKRVDVRFITATNKDLELAIQQNEFRKDLFYRLNVIPIHIPPLRERRDDIPILAEHFLGKYSKDMKRAGKRFAPEVKEAMMRHPWPGNIRELENAVQRSIALSDGDVITAKDLLETAAPTPDLRSVAAATARAIGEEGLDLDATMTDIETGYLKRALEITGGNYTKAAQLLKMSLRSFRYKLQKYGIDKEPD
ncbi:MAG TPA: sigma-54 dependent transcriptional regulator [Planctomycetota bacterium]|nr:sigma-54 dependent transcriptional regulator [Planctomycetota bacterium]